MNNLLPTNTLSTDHIVVVLLTPGAGVARRPQEMEGATVTCSVRAFRRKLDFIVSFFVRVTVQTDDCRASVRTGLCGPVEKKSKMTFA